MVIEKWFDLMLTLEEYADEHRPHLFANDDNLDAATTYQLGQGRPIENWDPNAYVRPSQAEYDDGPPYDILTTCLDTPVYSPRLQKELRRARCAVKDLQYLPLRVFRFNGEEIPGYAIANVISRIEALDHDNCFLLELDDDIDPLTGKKHVHSVGRFALKAAPLAGHDIIRLVEFWPPVFVSERFKRVFEEGGFTGACFSPVRVT